MATQSTLSQNLKSLLALDQKRESIISESKNLKQKIEVDKQMIPELQKSISELKHETIEAKKHVDLQELNAKDLREREKSRRAALDNVKNQKEYVAVEKELSNVTQQLSEQEDALEKAWHSLDLAKKKEESETVTLKQKIETLQNEIKKEEETIKKLNEDLEKINEEKSEYEKDVPQEWLKKYNRMREKVSDPIVPVMNTSCSACYYSIPPQDMNRLKKNVLLLCRSCYRLLYYNQEEEKDLKDESF
jgi:predicted  nucleic acid-binding Zn-ribbon protein